MPKEKCVNIAVTGKIIASGSTTLAGMLAEKLGWRLVVAGEIFREYCREKGWTIERYKDIPDSVDVEVDERAKKMLQNEKGIVYEGWLAGWLTKDMPHVFKVLCTAPLEVRIARFAEREGVAFMAARERVMGRDQTAVEKHRRLYGIENQFDERYFNLVVESDKLTPEEEVNLVLKRMGL